MGQPDIQWEGKYLEEAFESDSNRIVFSSARKFFRKPFKSGVCIKLCLEGEEKYYINNHPFLNRKGEFLVNNNESEVSVDFESRSDSKGICIYLSQDTINDTYSHLIGSNQLDECVTTEFPDFYEDIYKIDNSRFSAFLPFLKNIQPDKGATIDQKIFDLEHFYFSIAEALILEKVKIGKVTDTMDANKKSTRDELYKRATLAKNYIHSSTKEPFDLTALSKNVGVSKFQLIRIFQSVYGKTPKQYDLIFRMNRAKDLLESGDESTISSIAFQMGYPDLPTFSKAFKKVYAESPSHFLRNF